MEGQGSMLAPTSKVRAIQGRDVGPRAISSAVKVGRGADDGVAVGVTAVVGVGIGGRVAAKVGLGKGVSVGVDGRNWAMSGNSLTDDRLQAAKNGKPTRTRGSSL